MSQRNSRPPPFRFWLPAYWNNPTPAPRPPAPAPAPQRPPSRVPTSASSQPPTRPQPQQPATQSQPAAGAAARKAQKSPSPSPSPSPSASPSRRSPRLQPADQRARQPPSPSHPASKPSMPPREASGPKAAAAETPKPPQSATASSSQGAPEPSPPVLSSSTLPESTTKPPPLETQAPEKTLQPEAPTPEQIPTKPVPVPTEVETQPKQKSKTEQLSADSSQRDVRAEPVSEKPLTPTQPPKPESQPEEIKEEKTKPNLETSKQHEKDEKLEEIPKTIPETKPKQEVETTEQRKLDDKPKGIPEDKTNPDVEPKQDTQTSQVPKVDEKPKPDVEPKQDIQTSQVPKLDEKPKEIVKERVKPMPEKEQEMNLAETLKSERIPKESKDDEAQTEPEIHKPFSSVTDGWDKGTERKLSIKVADAEPKTGKLISDTRVREAEILKEQGKANGKEINQHQPIGQVSKVSISAGPWASSCDGERANFQKEIREGLSKLVQKLSIGHSGRPGSDQGVSIITLAGKNKGATMFIGSEDGIIKQSSEKQENNKVQAISDEERSKCVPTGNTPIAASVNSNVQSINNSLLNESKCEEGNPGVHLAVSTKPTEPAGLKEKMEPPKTQKTASSITAPQKLTYEPNIRRRCLRGLFLEPSEDDMEDMQKPRRHGCRVTCDEKKKEKEDHGEGTSNPNSNRKS